jgi:hypothetical protein
MKHLPCGHQAHCLTIGVAVPRYHFAAFVNEMLVLCKQLPGNAQEELKLLLPLVKIIEACRQNFWIEKY